MDADTEWLEMEVGVVVPSFGNSSCHGDVVVESGKEVEEESVGGKEGGEGEVRFWMGRDEPDTHEERLVRWNEFERCEGKSSV